ncbi:MAG TPA: hypothetical protein VK421_05800 [Pyrinomonadaceae bacterium]|nr:hypothetical protein [Pyrinomonadaceae bacterium]
MRTLLLLPLLLASVSQAQDAATGDGSSLVVLGSKWSSSRKAAAKEEPVTTAPAPTTTRDDRTYERRRMEDPTGLRYPERETLDARSAALEKNVRSAQTPERKAVEGFEYRARVRNAAAKEVEVVFWEYQFTEAANPANVVRRQFLCAAKIKPGKEKELQAFSPAGPSAVIDVGSLAAKSGDHFAGNVKINRVEYADGTIWQRRGWSFGEVRDAIARAVATPWGQEMCRGL